MVSLGIRDGVDAAIVASYFIGTLILGLRIARRGCRADLYEYALGSRQIPWWAVLGSIIAAEISAATFLGAPAEGYRSRNFLYCQLAIGIILARILVARIFIDLYYRHNVASIYEFLQIRFGPGSRNAASAIFIVGRLLGIGVRLYLGGVVFVVIWRSVFHHEPGLLQYCIGILAVLSLTTLYTALGGIKAVVYTDVLQSLLMFSSALCALVMLFLSLPHGFSTITAHVSDGFTLFRLGPLTQPGAFFSEPYSVFGAVIGMTCLMMATQGTDQDFVQRMLTARNQKESRFSLVLSGFVDFPIAVIFAAIGILLYVHYKVEPDTLLPAQPNEIFAHYIVTSLPVGVRGFVVAGLFATIMGSTSAALNSLSVSLTKDWYQPYFGHGADDRQLICFARRATVACAVVMAAVAVIAAELVRQSPTLTIIPLALGIMGLTYGSLLGVFLLGALTRDRGDDRMNVVAMCCGILAVVLLRNTVAWSWYTVIGSTVTFAVAVVFRTEKQRAVMAGPA